MPGASPKRYRSPHEFLWENMSPDYATLIQCIAEGLQKRAMSLGHRLQTLKFTGSLDAEAMELLRPYVDKLLITWEQ